MRQRGDLFALEEVWQEIMRIVIDLQYFDGEVGEPWLIEGTREVVFLYAQSIVFRKVEDAVCILNFVPRMDVLEKALADVFKERRSQNPRIK